MVKGMEKDIWKLWENLIMMVSGRMMLSVGLEHINVIKDRISIISIKENGKIINKMVKEL